jgi:hypothetical protein
LGNSWNIFFTQNLSRTLACEQLVLKTQAMAKRLFGLTECVKCTTGEVLPKLGRFNSGGLLINENSPDIGGSFRVYQCFILLLRRQVLDVAGQAISQHFNEVAGSQ